MDDDGDKIPTRDETLVDADGDGQPDPDEDQDSIDALDSTRMGTESPTKKRARRTVAMVARTLWTIGVDSWAAGVPAARHHGRGTAPAWLFFVGLAALLRRLRRGSGGRAFSPSSR